MTLIGARRGVTALVTTLGLTLLCLTAGSANGASAATTVTSTSVTSFQVQSAEDNRCLDADDSTGENGAKVQVWDCSGRRNQRWSFSAVVGASTAARPPASPRSGIR
ncbi:MAG: Ricin-type beta-trefoil lectin domain-like [Cryptosporangiaceae bacterium]|nr:Ricin-type beta-trefoil lectin domain-like [Cryptosporangiaceae bacterium]